MDDTQGGTTQVGAARPTTSVSARRSRVVAAILGCVALSGLAGGAVAWLAAPRDSADTSDTTRTVVGDTGDTADAGASPTVPADESSSVEEPSSGAAPADEGMSSSDTTSSSGEGSAEPEEEYDGPTIQPQPFDPDGLDAEGGFDVRRPTP